MSNTMQERVTDYCNELYARGEKVTVRMILAHFDEFESSSTVHKYYRHCKAELEANEKSLQEKLGFSTDFTKIFMREISHFSAEAEQRYKQMRDDAVEQCDQAIQDLARVEDRYEMQKALVEQQAKEITYLKGNQEKSDTAHESELARKEETHKTLVEDLMQQITRLEADLESTGKTVESLRTDLTKSELLLENNQTFVNDAKESVKENRTLAIENTNLSVDNAGLRKLVDSAEKRASELDTTNKDLNDKITKLDSKLDTLNSKVETLNDDVKEKDSEIESLNIKQVVWNHLTSKPIDTPIHFNRALII